MAEELTPEQVEQRYRSWGKKLSEKDRPKSGREWMTLGNPVEGERDSAVKPNTIPL